MQTTSGKIHAQILRTYSASAEARRLGQLGIQSTWSGLGNGLVVMGTSPPRTPRPTWAPVLSEQGSLSVLLICVLAADLEAQAVRRPPSVDPPSPSATQPCCRAMHCWRVEF